MKKIIWTIAALLGLVVALYLGSPNSFNPPESVESIEAATVVGGEFYPTMKFDAANRPKIRLRLDNGREILIGQNVPINLSNGDRVNVIVWRRRFFGYWTTYQPID